MPPLVPKGMGVCTVADAPPLLPQAVQPMNWQDDVVKVAATMMVENPARLATMAVQAAEAAVMLACLSVSSEPLHQIFVASTVLASGLPGRPKASVPSVIATARREAA